MVISSSGLRPKASESGPMSSWPAAIPTVTPVNEACTTPLATPKNCPMAGKAGRYGSIVKGIRLIESARMKM